MTQQSYSNKLKTCVHIKTHTPVFIGSSCSTCKVLDITQMHFSEWMDKQTLIPSYNGLLISNREEWIGESYNLGET